MRVPNRTRLRIPLVLALAAGLALSMSTTRAADNVGTGDIAGVDADLADSTVFTLNTATLGLVKRAFLASTGAALTSGTSLPKGTLVKFLIYIDNSTAFPVTDVSVQDVLDPAFAYQAGTIKVDNSLLSSAACPLGVCDEAAIFAAVDATSALNDTVAPGDVASYVGTTIDVGNQTQANLQLNLAASSVWAVSFTVAMQ